MSTVIGLLTVANRFMLELTSEGEWTGRPSYLVKAVNQLFDPASFGPERGDPLVASFEACAQWLEDSGVTFDVKKIRPLEDVLEPGRRVVY